MDAILRDVRYAFRGLLRTPGFLGAAVLTLAIGVGANVAIFGVIDAALFAPLPYRDADRLVTLRGSFRSRPASASITPADFVDYRARAQSFESLAAAMPSTGRVNFTGSGEPEQILGHLVTGNYFQTLGVQPILGRGLIAEDDQVTKPAVAVLAHGFWQRRFSGDPRVVGLEILLDGLPCQIVGVMPAGIGFSPADVWAPLPFLDTGFTSRSAHFLRPIGRLKEGISLERAQAELDSIAGSLARDYPATNLDWRVQARLLREELVGPARSTLQVLGAIVGLVLLLACVNVSGLFLIRNSRRRHEIAVRLSLGASRSTITRLVFAEGLIVATLGAVVAISILWATRQTIVGVIPGIPTSFVPDRERIAILASVVAILASIAVSILPSMHATRAVETALKSRSRTASAATRRAHSALAVSQLAVALVLLSGTALFVFSLQKLLAVPVGFDSHNVATVRVSLPQAKYGNEAQVQTFFETLLNRIEATPGVESASLVDTLPLAGLGNDNGFAIREYPLANQSKVTADYRQIDSEYFHALRIPIRQGRPFTRQEARSRARVAIISDTLAERFISDSDPIGKHVVSGGVEYEIVGVAGDVLHRGLRQPPYQTLYVPALDVPETSLVVRSSIDGSRLAELMRGAVRELDRDVPVPAIQSLASVVDASVRRQRSTTVALMVMAVLALLIASVGVYGVTALTVAERMKEIGIRSALGASSREVRQLVFGQGLRITAAAIAIGTPLALLAARASASLLFGVQPHDPAIFAGMIAMLGIVAMAATYVPARRASKIDPALLLRAE